MNILITLAVAAGGMAVLWAFQSVMLALAGRPQTWPLQFEADRPLLKATSRIIVHSEWLIILIGTPLALGIRPLDALAQAFRLPVPWRAMGVAFLVVFVPICLVYAAYLALGWAKWAPQHDAARRHAKLFRRFLPGPIPLATFEEGVFRGLILEQLLRSLPQTALFAGLAVVASSAVFASIHFIKPPKGKPIRLFAWGYFIVGCLFGFAYLKGGRTLWLPIVVHATCVFCIEVARLYVVFQKPRWLMGHIESPQSGVVGSALVLAMAVALAALV
ncbi:MAG TPA: CPBP family intramembrane glutamic endopeptidase [Caulobacteraceae bacterium]|jgi:hypothetical protein